MHSTVKKSRKKEDVMDLEQPTQGRNSKICHKERKKGSIRQKNSGLRVKRQKLEKAKYER